MPLCKDSKIFVTDHHGVVGSALDRKLQSRGFDNVLLPTRSELDLLDQAAVHAFLAEHKPDWVPKITLPELVKERVETDYTAARRHNLVKAAGFQAYDYNE